MTLKGGRANMTNVKILNLERTYQKNNTQIKKNNQVRFGKDNLSLTTNPNPEENKIQENPWLASFRKCLGIPGNQRQQKQIEDALEYTVEDPDFHNLNTLM